MTAASALFHVESPRVARNLRERLEKRRSEFKSELSLSGDWPDFKYRMGKVIGINEAILFLDELENNERN